MVAGDWKTELVEASYRGAKFYVKLSDVGVGRQTQLFPVNKSTPKIQDSGVDIDEFEIEGYVIQNKGNNFNYFDERNALIEALRKGSTTEPTKTNPTEKYGILKHPFFGELKVALLGKARIIESFDDGGIARFNMTFVRYEEKFFGEGVDHLTKVDTSVLSMINSGLDSFTDFMETTGAFLSTLTSPITQLMVNIQGAVSSISGAIAATVSSALLVISTGITLIDTLLNTPCALANQIKGSIESVLGLVGMAGDVVQGGIIGSCSGEERGETTKLTGDTVPSELGRSIITKLSTEIGEDEADIDSVPVEQEKNLNLIVNFYKIMIIANNMKIAIRVEYESQSQMEETLNLIANDLDDLLIRLGEQVEEQTVHDVLLYNSIEDARSVFISSMLEKYIGLKKEIQYDIPPDIISTLELSYNKYFDISREEEVFNRNKTKIRHPGFLPSGDQIAILNE